MATYIDIANALTGQEFEPLRKKTVIATTIKAQATLAGAAPVERKNWAKNVLSNPENEAAQLLRYTLAANNTLTIAQMATVADNTLQTTINNAVDLIYPAA